MPQTLDRHSPYDELGPLTHRHSATQGYQQFYSRRTLLTWHITRSPGHYFSMGFDAGLVGWQSVQL